MGNSPFLASYKDGGPFHSSSFTGSTPPLPPCPQAPERGAVHGQQPVSGILQGWGAIPVRARQRTQARAHITQPAAAAAAAAAATVPNVRGVRGVAAP